ncbi:MAG: hypothetical protein PHV87_07445, partial [Bacilli bacterium]|nr:hypothetical protein [Bacilli bacterium]
IYLADPENWQKEYYRSYNQYFAGPVIADDQRLIYDRDFSLITAGVGSYVLYYDYGYNDDDEVYVLTITKIVKGNKELVSDIYLGRWKKGC